jgi:hypothetical protein
MKSVLSRINFLRLAKEDVPRKTLGMKAALAHFLLLLLPTIAVTQPLVCLSEIDVKSTDYRLQEPVGLFDGYVGEKYHVIDMYLDPLPDREVFALDGLFAIKDGARRIAPVFICNKDRSELYITPEYKVGCPRDYGSPVKIFFLNAELIRIHRAMLTYWTPTCVAKRTIELDCEHWQKYPDIERKGWDVFYIERFYMDPRNRELPFICKAEKTIQFMTPIEP